MMKKEYTSKNGKTVTIGPGNRTGIELILPDEILQKIDDWRAQFRPIPPRTDACIMLVQSGLK